MGKKRRQLLIYFDADAAGGKDLVGAAMASLNTGEEFALPAGWFFVGVRGGRSPDDRAKILTLRYRRSDGAPAIRPDKPPFSLDDFAHLVDPDQVPEEEAQGARGGQTCP